ncbi:Gfo/Idh/MocA family oxidoreductase [Treponema sp.]|uniref:Gfo/Idh/MocA family protein n=1 Tax=Treponema sp. TaxID=166 RepID=UPI0025F7DB5D|nr:Gfo/Idh/MocA family oxidoreductase [Treponema sp.]MCR5217914.1 Gfo/Idh/MocA family oxidoreductase [Treponema sp.]
MSLDGFYTAALIGCGRIGFSLGHDEKREQPASHTMALMDNPRIKIIAGCDNDSEKLKAWHEEVPCAQVFESSSALYQHLHPDIIVVAVNEAYHLEEALAAIDAGPKLIILEKPVALNLEEAFKIKEAAEKKNVPVLINHERRFSEDYMAAKNYMASIGQVIDIKATLYSSMAVYDQEEEGSGAYSLIHDGTHLSDIVLYFLEDLNSPSTTIETLMSLGKPGTDSLSNPNDSLVGKEVKQKKIIVNTILKRPVLTGVVRDENGVVRQACAHYVTHVCPEVELLFVGRSKYFGFEIEINGTEGRVCIGNGYCKFYHAEESDLYSDLYSLRKDTSVKIPEKTRYFSNMIQNAIDFLDEKECLKSTLQTGINALAILEEIRKLLKGCFC